MSAQACLSLLERHRFQTKLGGKEIDLYTLHNRHGMQVGLCNYGARILQILVPDRQGELADVIVGYDSIEAVLAGHPSMGAFIGRYANRIGHACFTLNGKNYQLGANHAGHCLHGGYKGSRFIVFNAVQLSHRQVEMHYTFADGEEGFPGTLELTLRYVLGDDNTLALEWCATARDQPTIASFTGHTFFNLTGQPNVPVTDHIISIPAEHFLPLDTHQLPTGEIAKVAGTPFDFRSRKTLGLDINSDHDQLKMGHGYDHYFILNRPVGNDTPTLAAHVEEPQSGRVMEVWTSEPGLQLFSGNSLGAASPQNVGKGDRSFAFRGGLCIEPSRFPDAPNHPGFPSPVLQTGESYRGSISYRFPTPHH